MSADAVNLPGFDRPPRNTWDIRLSMASLGWQSKLEIRDIRGTFSCYAAFLRWDWHGRRSMDVILHASGEIGKHPSADCLPVIRDIVHKAATLASDAWRLYPQSVPCQMPEGYLPRESTSVCGRFAVNSFNTDYAFGPRGDRPDGAPTEAIPLDTLPFSCADERFLRAAVGLALLPGAAWYSDQYSPSRWSHGAYLRRKWGLDFGLTFRTWRGVEIDISRFRQSVETCDESFAAHAIKSQNAALSELLATYDPARAGGSLPPMLRENTTWILDRFRDSCDAALERYAVGPMDRMAYLAMQAEWTRWRLECPVLTERHTAIDDDFLEYRISDFLSNRRASCHNPGDAGGSG